MAGVAAKTNNSKGIVGVTETDVISFKAYWRFKADRKSTRLNSSHTDISRMPSSA